MNTARLHLQHSCPEQSGDSPHLRIESQSCRRKKNILKLRPDVLGDNRMDVWLIYIHEWSLGCWSKIFFSPLISAHSGFDINGTSLDSTTWSRWPHFSLCIVIIIIIIIYNSASKPELGRTSKRGKRVGVNLISEQPVACNMSARRASLFSR